MESEEIINNLASKHVLNIIVNYIKDENFKDKLFLYSKKFQKKFEMKLIGLKENYLKKIKFDLDKYLYIESDSFKKDFLAKKYDEFLMEKKLIKKN